MQKWTLTPVTSMKGFACYMTHEKILMIEMIANKGTKQQNYENPFILLLLLLLLLLLFANATNRRLFYILREKFRILQF